MLSLLRSSSTFTWLKIWNTINISKLYAICLTTSHEADFGQIEDKEKNEVIHSFIEIQYHWCAEGFLLPCIYPEVQKEQLSPAPPNIFRKTDHKTVGKERLQRFKGKKKAAKQNESNRKTANRQESKESIQLKCGKWHLRRMFQLVFCGNFLQPSNQEFLSRACRRATWKPFLHNFNPVSTTPQET